MTHDNSANLHARQDRAEAARFVAADSAAGLLVSISIDTAAAVAAAYGADRLRAAVETLHRSAIAEAGPVPGLCVDDLRWLGFDRLALFVVAPKGWPEECAGGAPMPPAARQARLLQWLLKRLSRPVDVDGERLVLSVSGSIGPATLSGIQQFGTCATDPVGSQPGIAPFPKQGAQSPSEFRAAMEIAVRLHDELIAGNLAISWQKIAASRNPARILYSEGLLRSAAGDSVMARRRFQPGMSILATEQVGAVRRVDAWVVEQTIRHLRDKPDAHLGCNISAQSVVLDAWWAEAVSQLAAEPCIARRLVIEITETAGFASLAVAAQFCRQMKALGCRIAIDDFGTGGATISNVTALNPDIIKIDSSLLRSAVAGGDWSAAREELTHLLGFARCRGRAVVMEGVETAEARDVAVQVGGEWLQGFDVALPHRSVSLHARRPSAFPPDPGRRASAHVRIATPHSA